jgi:site-specific recombinase XerD
MLDITKYLPMILKASAISWWLKCCLAPAYALAELLGLKDQDINDYEGTLKVLGKRNKERIIPINTELRILLLAEYLELKKNQNFHNNSVI